MSSIVSYKASTAANSQDKYQQPQRRESNLSSRVKSITDCYMDKEGRAIKLWRDAKYGLVGVVLAPGKEMKVIAGDHIRNGINPAETGAALYGKLVAAPNQSWALAYVEETGKIDVWPQLKAAANNKFNVASSINPFKEKTLEQCGEMLRAKGFELKYTNLENGGQRYENPVTGRRAYLDPGNSYRGGNEPPHVDMYYAAPGLRRTVPAIDRQGNFLRDDNGEVRYKEHNVQGKKFPLNPSHKDWSSITNKARDAYARHERNCGRDPFAQSPVPTMQKGGVEFALAPLSKLKLQEHMKLLVPLGSANEKLTFAEAHQIIQELFVGIYICNEVPSLAMDPKPNKSVAVSVPAPYSGTLVGDVLKEVDALGKGVMQGIVFPEYARRAFINDWEQLLKIQPDGLPRDYDYEETLAIYRAYGARELDPSLLRELDDANADLRMVASQINQLQMNYTFVARQNSIKQEGDTVLLDSDLVVSGSFQMSDSVSKAVRKQLQVAFDKSADTIGSVLKQIPEAQRPLNLLNYIGFVTQMMMTMKKEELMPDLNALSAVPVVYEPEEEMPPFLKIRSQGDQAWYLHGASGIDFTKVPKASLSSKMKEELKRTSFFAKGGRTVYVGDIKCICVPMHVVTFDDDKQSPKWLYEMLKDYQDKQPSSTFVDFSNAPNAPDERVVGGGSAAGGFVGFVAGSGAAPIIADGLFISEAACTWAGVGIAVGSGAVGAIAAAGIGYAVYSRAKSKYDAFWNKALTRPQPRINHK